MIEFDQIHFGYLGAEELFSGFSWGVNREESWAVLGPSGCGKTSLLYLTAGLLTPDQGRVTVQEQPVLRPRPETGLILQDYGLLPWATVRGNIELGMKIRRFYGPDGTHAPRIEQSLDDVNTWLDLLGIQHLAEKYPAQISGGERQRAAIARTLILDPDLLLMDEPLASLDAPTRASLQDVLLELRDKHHLTLITVTHTIEEAAVLGEKILLLGEPPHRTPYVIDNPQGGKPGYRGCSDYYQLISELEEYLTRQREEGK
jgi:NitT/TauT family transport system ATP-binding protein